MGDGNGVSGDDEEEDAEDDATPTKKGTKEWPQGLGRHENKLKRKGKERDSNSNSNCKSKSKVGSKAKAKQSSTKTTKGGGIGAAAGPKFVLSAGSGDDFMYEHFVADQWPGVTVVTTDCFQFDEPVRREFDDGKGQILVLPTCLTGSTPEYVQFAPPNIQDRFVSFATMMEDLKRDYGIDHFDLIKCTP